MCLQPFPSYLSFRQGEGKEALLTGSKDMLTFDSFSAAHPQNLSILQLALMENYDHMLCMITKEAKSRFRYQRTGSNPALPISSQGRLNTQVMH